MGTTPEANDPLAGTVRLEHGQPVYDGADWADLSKEARVARLKECFKLGSSYHEAGKLLRAPGDNDGRNTVMGYANRHLEAGDRPARVNGNGTRSPQSVRKKKTLTQEKDRPAEDSGEDPGFIDSVDELDKEIPLGQRRTLQELTEETCRWPVGDPCTPEFFFCGGKPLAHLPYCNYHSRVSYQPAHKRRR